MITGASKGLGKELALEFSKKYNIIINGRDANALNEIYKKINPYKDMDKCTIILGDITNEKTLENLTEKAKDGLDILINNAGIYYNNPDEINLDELRKVMEVNFFAQANLISRILPIFIAKQKGLIVNINSIAGKFGSLGEYAYCASKHALRGFSESLRYDLTKQGIRILDVYLGAMRTPMTAKRPNQELLIDPREVAKVIVKNCELYKSLSVNEINMRRRNYG